MGRPREHHEQTAAALLDAAERIVEEDGVDALSVRRVAGAVGTTTRAVYSLFGSKDGLVVALGRRAFELLGTEIEALPATSDPAADLVEAGVAVFRRFAVDHPSLFEIGVQRVTTAPELSRQFDPTARAALEGLDVWVGRLDDAGLLGRRTAREARLEFHALCEGLAAIELRGLLPAGHEEQTWRSALEALITGFSHAPPPS